jgi:hypothetical protein
LRSVARISGRSISLIGRFIPKIRPRQILSKPAFLFQGGFGEALTLCFLRKLIGNYVEGVAIRKCYLPPSALSAFCC